MNHKERVYSALQRKGYDRIPVKHQGTPEADEVLMQYFGISDQLDLLTAVGDDFRSIVTPWIGPELKTHADGSWDGWWGERYANISFGHGTYPEAVYLPFADVEDVADLSRFRMPSADDFDYSTVKNQCSGWAEYATVFGNAGFFDFINSIARCRGVEKVLFDIAERNPVYLALMDQRFQLFYDMTERALQAAGGAIDIVHVGEDFGSQRGLLISPKTFDELFRSKYENMFSLAHRYGATTMMHCCGSVRKLIPRFMDIGLDVLDVIQVSAAGMDIRELHDEYGKDLSFCGSMCVQSTLPFGSQNEVRNEVKLRLKLFEQGGLILGPSHQIQAGTPLENILAMYQVAGSIKNV
ncbi:MAG: uroporphyrinogen decarboxylase family protein [Anaerolineae bacterium]|nr:uroporphyrinogen decarboxylase family protein [Anaerolineae bacterium]